MASTQGRYVPPHLRKAQLNAGDAPPIANNRSPVPRSPAGGSKWSSSTPPSGGNDRRPWSDRDGAHTPRGGHHHIQRDPPPHQRGSSGPSLFVFGDSFVGPFKSLSDRYSKTQTFKGSSAKGLNNPKSSKQVSNELVPLSNRSLAPPPYAYSPPSGRYASLIFGNVDLQINYLWQSQHKPLGPGTWSDVPAVAPAASEESETERILANATENEGRGPALGPERFVDTVSKAYTTWLEREVVNGPVGRRAAAIAAPDAPDNVRRSPPTKVLVAAASPPSVQDETSPRIPQKYVERLEADHVSAQRAFERGENAPRSTTRLTPETIETAMARASSNESPVGKMTVQQLLVHDPPLCTKPVRIEMTERFNQGSKAFCEQHSNVLGYVDIAEAMHNVDSEDAKTMAANGATEADRSDREVSRATWACPVDPSNIHPLWEPTLPLWSKALKAQGVPTDQFAMSDDAEATFKAYEEDKRRRMNPAFADKPAEAVKIREEE